MGGLVGGSKPKGPSAEQLRLQAEQAELAKKQREQLEEQKVRLAEQEEEAKRVAESERQRRIKGLRNRNQGRASLIATDSELGTQGQLG